MIPPSDLHSTPYLVHFFGGGLVDRGECYAVERFRAHVDGDIRRWPAGPSAQTNGRTRPAPEIASVDEVRELRPAYNEIIVCTGLGTRSGVQYWVTRHAGCGVSAGKGAERRLAAKRLAVRAGLPRRRSRAIPHGCCGSAPCRSARTAPRSVPWRPRAGRDRGCGTPPRGCRCDAPAVLRRGSPQRGHPSSRQVAASALSMRSRSAQTRALEKLGAEKRLCDTGHRLS